jgi:crotonobetainyl-CoA:carnitine CoA-transferase CaiB-like acyl-CoA transferase
MSFPLEGIRILELGQIIAGTYGSQVLSDLGAEVIKVESPEGDLGRIPSVAPYRGLSALFLTLNRNKESVVINLKREPGRALFYDLVKVADVVVDNFRPGVLERLKIDYDILSRLNPRLIQCSVTGFGTTGAYKDYPALDIIIQAISGHMAITGEPGRPPVRIGIPLADISGGIYSCKGILAALFERERTGRGSRVELSMFDAMLHLLGYIGTLWLTAGVLPQPPGSAHDYTVPWQAFAAKDGYLVVATRQEGFWKKLCGALG